LFNIDIITVLIAIGLFIFLCVIVSALIKRKRDSEKLDRRISGIRREFEYLKDESTVDEDTWIDVKLKDESGNLKDRLWK